MDRKGHNKKLLSQTRQKTVDARYRFFFRFNADEGITLGFYILLATAIFSISLNENALGQPMPEKKNPHYAIVEYDKCENYIKIDGSTNINHFHFIQNLDGKKKKVEMDQNVPEILTLKIPARDFEPSNPMMYKDFLDFIKADDYPNIDITIFLENIRFPAGHPVTILPKIKVGLAGKTHTYKIPGEIHQCHNSCLHIDGEVNINLNDFGLEPPTKFMGMIKVNSEVFINFGLTLEE